MTRGRLLVALATVACGVACGKGSTAPAPATSPKVQVLQDGGATSASGEARAPVDPRTEDLWTRAIDGDSDDLARLTRQVGVEELIEGFGAAPRRLTVLRALAFADDFTALPFLARAAGGAPDDEASAALASISSLAAEPRRATDVEEALEIRDGCALLLATAKDMTRPPQRRALVIGALRLLADRGWVEAAQVPTDLDAR